MLHKLRSPPQGLQPQELFKIFLSFLSCLPHLTLQILSFLSHRRTQLGPGCDPRTVCSTQENSKQKMIPQPPMALSIEGTSADCTFWVYPFWPHLSKTPDRQVAPPDKLWCRLVSSPWSKKKEKKTTSGKATFKGVISEVVTLWELWCSSICLSLLSKCGIKWTLKTSCFF